MTSVFLSGKTGVGVWGVCVQSTACSELFLAVIKLTKMSVKEIPLTLYLQWRSNWENCREEKKNSVFRNCWGGMNSCMFMSHIYLYFRVISASICSWWALLLCVPWENGLRYKAWNPLSAFQIILGLLQNPAEKLG